MKRTALTSCAALALFGAACGATRTPAYAGALVPIATAAGLRAAADLGRAPGATPLALTAILHYRHEAELAAFVDAQGDPHSPFAHHALTAAQFDAYFAPSAPDYARVLQVFARRGFTIVHAYANRTAVEVTGPIAVVERTFGTELHAVRRADGTLRYTNVRPAYLPAEMTPIVFGVVGLDTGEGDRPGDGRSAGDARLRPYVAPGPPLEGPKTGFGPEAYARAYDMPDRHAVPGATKGTTYDGTDIGVALIANDDFNEPDLDGYLDYFKIRRSGPATTRIKVDGGAQRNGIFSLVTTLQAETLVGLSPGITLYDYGIPELSDRGLLDAYERIVTDDDAAVALSPVFDCPGGTTPPNLPKLADHLALQGAALGIAFVINSGDNFGESCSQGPFTPADAPHFVSVGGTILLIDAEASYKLELASTGSGGGLSTIFSLPAYQRGVAGIRGARRNIPDVAFDGDPASGGALYQEHYWTSPSDAPNDEFGNELSAAIFTSMVAQWTQYHGSSLGDLHGTLYGAFTEYGYAKPAGAPLFHDITLGSAFAGQARPGYDFATGIGSIDGWNFAKALL